MKKSCSYFDHKYKCVSFIVRYKGLTLQTHSDLDTAITHIIGIRSLPRPTIMYIMKTFMQ